MSGDTPSKRARKRVVGSPRNVAQIELDRAYGFDRNTHQRNNDIPRGPAEEESQQPNSTTSTLQQVKSNTKLLCIFFAGLFLSAYDAAARHPPACSATSVITRTSAANVWRLISTPETWNTWSHVAPTVKVGDGVGRLSKSSSLQLGQSLLLAPPRLHSSAGQSLPRDVEWRAGSVTEVVPGAALCWSVASYPPSWVRHSFVGTLFARLSRGSHDGDGKGLKQAPMALPHVLLHTERCLLVDSLPARRDAADEVKVAAKAAALKGSAAGLVKTITSLANLNGKSFSSQRKDLKVPEESAGRGASSDQRGWGKVGGGGGAAVQVTNTAALAGLLAPLVAAWAVGPSWLLPWSTAKGSIVVGGSEGGVEATPDSLAAFLNHLQRKLGR